MRNEELVIVEMIKDFSVPRTKSLMCFCERLFRALPLFFALFLLQPLWADDNSVQDAGPVPTEAASSGPLPQDADFFPDEAPPPDTASPSETAPAAAVQGGNTIEKQRRDTLRFGTETEIANLIQTLKDEKVSYLDKDLIDIAQNTRNRNILAGIFSFFGDMGKTGLEDRAIRAVAERDQEANESVAAAIDYLGKVKAGGAVDCLEELINSGESRFLNAAIRALGRAGAGQGGTQQSDAKGSGDSGTDAGTDRADKTASFLLDYYNNGNPSDDNKREIVVALGETGSKAAVSFLAGLVTNSEERTVLRMAALDAIAKIDDPAGLDAVVEAVSSTDPNVRSSAVAALGPFSGEAADNAILEGFRDSYYRTRIGSAQAAGKRKLVSAIPYLQYRAANDDVPSVKDEAIRALGAINNDDTTSILASLFSERKNSDRVRVLAADMLLQNAADKYGKQVEIELEEARSKKQTALYNGFIRVLTTAKSDSLKDLARRYISGGSVIEKSLALDLILNNQFSDLADQVRPLLDEQKNGVSIARKAKNTLEKLGLDSTP